MNSAPSALRGDRTPWLVAGMALAGLLAVLLVLLTRQGASGPPMSGASAGGEVADGPAESGTIAPDIGRLSPRERFDRLYDRVMRAEQAGDDATVARFTPMALMAYEQLDTYDAGTRYHAALLQLHRGEVAGPTAQADTILRQNPGHLFGYVIQGTVARWTRDDRALARAYEGFLKHVDDEMASGRPEYALHRTSLDAFRQAASGGASRRPGP